MDNYTLENEPIRTQTKKETDKKCPRCGGTMDFDPLSGGLLCPYCDYKEEIKNTDENAEINRAEELDFSKAEEYGNCDWGMQTKNVICKSCGAESIYDVMQTSGECPYCGSNQVMEAKWQNTLAPGGVVPFKIDQNIASQRFKSWIGGKLFCPNAAKESAKAEAFTGIYLPYWTFDTETHSDYTARYGINHTRRDRNGNHITETRWYNTSGSHDEFFNDQLVIATDRHEKAFLRAIEPFDTESNVEYKPEYIAGFVSERYSTGLQDGWTQAQNDIKSSLLSKIKSKIITQNRADKVDNLRMNTTFSNVKYKYLMLPVWISSFKYNGTVYQFMVNGQTGKVGGKTPISAIKVIIAVLIVLAALGILYTIFNAGGRSGDYYYYGY